MVEIITREDDPRAPWVLLDEFETLTRGALNGEGKRLDPETAGYTVLGLLPQSDGGWIPAYMGVPAGRRARPADNPHLWQPDRPMVVELAARTTVLRSKRWDPVTQSLSPPPEEFEKILREKWPGQFDCELAIGVGWFDLVMAVQSWLEQAGDKVTWFQIKEKLADLRMYGDIKSELAHDVTLIAEVFLSPRICEVCGALGQRRYEHGWYYTSCDLHIRKV